MSSVVVLGRSPDCDVVLSAQSVSGRHARLAWEGSTLVLEDLGSENGTWVHGERITRAAVKPGADVRLAEVPLPWSDPRIGALLRAGSAMSRTIAMMPRFGRYTCPSCKKTHVLPPGFVRGELTCPSCGEALSFGQSRVKRLVRWLAGTVGGTVLALGIALAAGLWLAPDRMIAMPDPIGALARRRAGAAEPQGGSTPVTQLEELLAPLGPPVGSPEEASVRVHSAAQIQGAIDARDPVTRNLAVQVASTDDGPFRVEQVARIWKHARLEWSYVNDPRGGDYFARASETITNDFAGDCDDFAIVLAAMIEAIGGRTRVVLMDGPEGGHAYTEVCIDGPPDEVSQKIARFYRRSWDRRLGARPAQAQIHFRTDTTCPVWLNLDWSTNVIGGPYGEERYAIAVYSDGRTETLTPAHPERPATARTTLPPRRPLTD